MTNYEKLKQIGAKVFQDDPRESYEQSYRSKWAWLSRKKVLLPVGILLGFVIFYALNYTYNYAASGGFTQLLRASLYREKVPPINRFGLMVDVTRNPVMALVFLLIAIGIPFGIGVYLRSIYKPLTETFTQDTTDWATEKDLEHSYVDEIVTIHENQPWPALLPENIVGIPVHRFKQTQDEKEKHLFRLAVGTEPANNIVLAHTRAGKEVYFISPTLYILTGAADQRKRSSIIYVASAGTEPRKWYHMLKSRGYRIRVINTVDPSLSDPYPMFDVFISHYTDYYNERQKGLAQMRAAGNDLEAIKTARVTLAHADKWLDDADKEISSLANMIIPDKEGKSDDFWVKAPRGLFKAMAFALIDQSLTTDQEDTYLIDSHEEGFTVVNGYTISTVVNRMINEHITEKNADYLYGYAQVGSPEFNALLEKYNGKSLLEVYFSELPEGSPAKQKFYSMQSGAEAKVTIANIVQNFNNAMDPFLRSGIGKMTAAKDDFNFDDLGYDKTQPTALFIMLSTTDTENNALGLLAIEQVFRRLDLRAQRSDQEAFDRRVDLFDDEAGTVGRLIDIKNKWTGSLKRQFYMHLIFQSISQMKDMYGEQITDTLLGDAGVINYIRSGETTSNNYIKDRLGKRANYDLSRQRSVGGFHASNMEKVERIPLLDNFQLSQLKEGENVVVTLRHTRNARQEPVVQKPIRSSVERGTDLFPIYKWADLGMVGWDQLHLKNDFVLIDRESMSWVLRPNQRAEMKVENLPVRSLEATQKVAEETGTEVDHAFDQEQPQGPVALPKNLEKLNARENVAEKLRQVIVGHEEQNAKEVMGEATFNSFKETLGQDTQSRENKQKWDYVASLDKVSMSQLVAFTTTDYPLRLGQKLYQILRKGG